jgi:hypothetical protein
MPQSTQKNYRCGILRLSRTTLECQQKGKFWVRAKFAFLHKLPKNLNASKKQGKD